MSNVLGIDYGERKIGIAVGDTDSNFAEPLMVVRYKKKDFVIEKIRQIAEVERAVKIVLGVSEGVTAEKTKDFGASLGKTLKLPIEYYDETLSTKEAQRLSIAGGIKRRRRKEMEDAFAATFMLQNYLESLR
jgi:putative holliday junction resolvase